tara:strand:+ start:378 stop:755 length:378 start_codon:yes stop_codon:yes gene_type:complete
MIIEALNTLGINSEFCVDANVTTEEHYLRTYRDLSNENRFFEWSVVWNKMQELQVAEPMRLLRIERNRRLAETDWTAIRAYSQKQDVPENWASYMQALRDLPSTAEPQLDEQGNLTNITWPEKPE